MQHFDDFPYDFLRGPVIVKKANTTREKPSDEKGAKDLVETEVLSKNQSETAK